MSKVLPIDNNQLVIAQMLIKTVDIYLNSGQIPGLPANPKYTEEKGWDDLRNSLNEDPEFLNIRPLVVIPYAGAYVVIGGNGRLKMCIELHILEVPCIVLNENTPVDKLKRFLIKDNVNYGKWDWDMIANDFDTAEIEHWGVELPYFGEPSGDEDNGELKIEQFKLTLDCGTNHEVYEQLKLKLVPILEKMQGVELRG